MKARAFLARALRMGVTLLVVAVAVFFMVRLSGDPIGIMAGPDADPTFIAQMRERWGLDRPLHEQLVSFLIGIAQGEFGYSMSTGLPAAQLFLERLPATLVLGIASLTLSIVIGLPLGVAAAVRHNSALDRFVMSLSVMAFSMPNFFLGVLFILLFSLHLRWLPSFGSGSLAHLVMPVLTLGLSSAGAIARFARSCMLDVLNQPYMLAARARGIRPQRRTLLHALPNASIPLVTILGMRLGDLIAGAIIVETVFAWPGIGRLLAESVSNRDLAVVQVIVLATATTMVLANLAVDLLYGWLDPRVRKS
ncbi:ABC transporter permease [Pelagibacterium sp. H642]|uniref:ABC transporter permease n=1 Tax=Pelagibacterium sp. H642 TaxID=1881069 RepID=UPI0028152228|nr:ABC transporter permease [Pelagibacterium sp. H642]WMT92729.1 ABC transporter permease [Pelagibacterium sp. H642]